ncbi:MAG: methyltransferase domain-containing protein [Actinomycetota bacterium]|nr:methyltransferase domain-containing protein [Actinomycetota bacterium]
MGRCGQVCGRTGLGRREGALTVARADARALPFPDETFEAVACSMALMVAQPAEAVLGEVRRVLVPGGSAVFLVPGSYPLSARDRYRYARSFWRYAS